MNTDKQTHMYWLERNKKSDMLTMFDEIKSTNFNWELRETIMKSSHRMRLFIINSAQEFQQFSII